MLLRLVEFLTENHSEDDPKIPNYEGCGRNIDLEELALEDFVHFLMV